MPCYALQELCLQLRLAPLLAELDIRAAFARCLEAPPPAAVSAAIVALQRSAKDDEEIQAAETIRASGGEIIELTPAERQLFVDAVTPIYDEARTRFAPELLELVGL